MTDVTPTDFATDVAAILARRHDNGADFWATADGRVYVGNPFSTIGSLLLLHELGIGRDHEVVDGALAEILAACRDDGRIRVAPKAPLYPCYTAEAARVLCRFGLESSDPVERTTSHLLETAHDGGGWRCNFTKMGRGPGTELANPGATLNVLDVLRFFPEYRAGTDVVDAAVESLLRHWETRVPTGPCQHGIGSRFMRVEYPFLRYNVYFYVYVLSHFALARSDRRFRESLSVLEDRVDEDGRIVVEERHRSLSKLAFCAKGQPSEPATRRYREIVDNLGARGT